MSSPDERSAITARFAANLQRERRIAGISQEALAFRAGLHPTAIGLLERALRLPELTTIVKLAAGLESSVGSLLEGVTWHPGSAGKRGHFEVTPP